jgi:diaminohydroxyphosphoribosylaminopyrimidine deaminase/5-amino-6-(5-phosphoribosylamino)uracil reductase
MHTAPALDESFMRRALRLAMNGRGHVEPNPMVACVLVKDGRVIGEGYHAKYGGPHAEPTALANCTESPEGATAYVTLEPCCHTNKKTPPCAPRLIDAKVERVVIGCLDPNPDVNGKGVEMLRAAGIAVDGPVLEREAKQLIAPFLLRTQTRRPYVTLKWAQTADGKVAGEGGRRIQIIGEQASRVVHELRARCDAIMVGINTVINDDPLLTARGVVPLRRTVRIVLDNKLLIPLTSKLVITAGDLDVLVLCSAEGERASGDKVEALRHAGVEVLVAPSNEAGGNVTVRFATEGWNSSHLMVEPGPTLARSFFNSGLVERVWALRSPMRVNDDTAPAAMPVPPHYMKTGELSLGCDRLTEYLNPDSPAFFAAVPSADFVLARHSAGSAASNPP